MKEICDTLELIERLHGSFPSNRQAHFNFKQAFLFKASKDI